MNSHLAGLNAADDLERLVRSLPGCDCMHAASSIMSVDIFSGMYAHVYNLPICVQFTCGLSINNVLIELAGWLTTCTPPATLK
jgi:hypothetical protein